MFPYLHFSNPRRTVYCAVQAESVYFGLIDLCTGYGIVIYEMSVSDATTRRSNILSYWPRDFKNEELCNLERQYGGLYS